MLLCLDVGNTHILAGVYDGEKLALRFRHATQLLGTADQFGIFLRNILSANGIDGADIMAIAMSSVVPSVNFTIRHAFTQYFGHADFFELKAGTRTGLNIRYKNPSEVGADSIANAIGAAQAFPKKNVIIVDMDTATTLCAVGKGSDYLGGLIMPGLRVAMESLKSNTAKLTEVDIEPQTAYLGQTTRESIQKGLFFGHLGAVKEIIAGLENELFPQEEVTVIGTGGFAQMFRELGVFDVILPDLVLQGLKVAQGLSQEKARSVKKA
jgi:type III pantothenate kinase